MTIRYLLIDDEPSAEAYGVALQKSVPGLEIDVVGERKPHDIEKRILESKADGLLLDLQLTRYKGDADEWFLIEGPGLAQEIRTKSHSEPKLSIPIVGFSFDQRRETLIGNDSTPLDLFDDFISKGAVQANAALFAQRLRSLALGYENLRKVWKGKISKKTVADILGITMLGLELHSSGFHQDFMRFEKRPIHNVAALILHNLIPFVGSLIDEATLAVRLGIDREKSGKDWTALIAKLPKELKYEGIFSDIHKRWWMWQVIEWWRSLCESYGSPAMISSEERTEILKEALKLKNLTAIQSTTKSPGSRFWHVCVKTGVPVDPAEGYALADQESMRPWHDKRYLSRNAALRYASQFQFEPGEIERLKIFGKTRSQNRRKKS